MNNDKIRPKLLFNKNIVMFAFLQPNILSMQTPLIKYAHFDGNTQLICEQINDIMHTFCA